MDRTQAFKGLEDSYQKFRPHYPTELLQEAAHAVSAFQASQDEAPPLVVDVGAGTGISTRQLREVLGPGWSFLGVEPGEAMRQQASKATEGESGIRYIDGRAEALPLRDGSVVLMLAAQAVQWFDRPAFYAEAARVLRPGGSLALLQNNRDWKRSPLLDSYERFLEEHSEGYTRSYRDFDLEAELRGLARFEAVRSVRHEWTRRLRIEEFIGMSTSSTKMQSAMRRLGEGEAKESLRRLLEAHAREQQVDVPYTSELILARRKPR